MTSEEIVKSIVEAWKLIAGRFLEATLRNDAATVSAHGYKSLGWACIVLVSRICDSPL